MYIDGLDELDNKILNVIAKNARLSYSEIGDQVGLSRVSVKNRMTTLEEKGIIKGYETIINPTSLPEGRRFFMDVVTDPDRFEAVVDSIARCNIIRKVYAVTGESRFRAEGFTSSNNRYKMFIKNLKHNLDGVKSISVQDVQYTIKDVDGGVDYVRIYDRAEGAEISDSQ